MKLKFQCSWTWILGELLTNYDEPYNMMTTWLGAVLWLVWWVCQLVVLVSNE